MVDFKQNVTTEYWDETLFDCEATREGAREMNEIARRYQARRLRPDEEPLVIHDTEEEYGAEIISSGDARVVVDMPEHWHTGDGNCIAKIQWDPNYQQTANEIHIWNNANGRVGGLLAPVLDHSEMSQWLIMPEAELHTGLTSKELGDMVRKLRKELRNLGVKVQDVRRANVGRVEGRDVVIDYGVMQL